MGFRLTGEAGGRIPTDLFGSEEEFVAGAVRPQRRRRSSLRIPLEMREQHLPFAERQGKGVGLRNGSREVPCALIDQVLTTDRLEAHVRGLTVCGQAGPWTGEE